MDKEDLQHIMAELTKWQKKCEFLQNRLRKIEIGSRQKVAELQRKLRIERAKIRELKKQIKGGESMNPRISEAVICRMALRRYGGQSQMVMTMEEMAELTKALSKAYRGIPDIGNLSEEIADVEIMLEQMKQHFDIHDLTEKQKAEKLARLLEEWRKGNEIIGHG